MFTNLKNVFPMKAESSTTNRRWTVLRLIAVGAVCLVPALSCHEELPVYQDPSRVLSLQITSIEQLNDHIAPPGRQAVRIILTGENIYDEVVFDSVHLAGDIRITWKRRPVRVRTMPLTLVEFKSRELLSNGRMLLRPGQQFTLETIWNLRTDDSVYLPAEMNFLELRKRVCDRNIACADPEVFSFEANLRVYDRVGFIKAPEQDFTFIGRIYIL
jgi:hypothetical protein